MAPQPFYQDRGTPITVGHVLRALTQIGYEVDLLTYPIGETLEIPGVVYHRSANPLRFGRVPVSFSWRKVVLDIFLAVKLRRLLERNRYEFVHAVEEAAFLVLATRSRRETPVLYDMQSSLPEQLALKWYFDFRPIRAAFDACERWLLGRVDLVVASPGLRGIVERQAPGTAVEEWLFPVRPPAVARDSVDSLRQELGIAADQPAIVYTGNFSSYQGLPTLVRSIPIVLASCPTAVFVLVGAHDGHECRTILRDLPASVASHLRVLVRVGKQDVDRYLELADVLVSPRSAGSNMPLKTFEYLATGKPIVATDIAAHRSILNDDTAVLVPGDERSIAAGIVRCLTDRTLAERTGRAASRHADEHLSWDAFLRFVRAIHSAPEGEEARISA